MSIMKAGLGAIAATAMILAVASPTYASPVAKSDTQTRAVKAGTSDATDFSSAKRRYRAARRGNGGAAAAAAFAGIVGTAIAASAARDRYDDGYYGRRGYYGGGPGYYNRPGYGYGGYYGNRW